VGEGRNELRLHVIDNSPEVSMTPDEVLRLAALLSRKIMDRRPEIQENTRYYKGTEGRMKFASDEFRDYFARRFAGFSDNWCMPVAQAPIERANHLGIRLPGEKTFDSDLARMWERNDADRGLSEALLMMTIAKRSFGLVSPTPVGARITFENPDSAAIVYDAITRERKAGLAIWQDDTTEFASLYLPNSVLSLKRDRRGVPATDHYIWPAVDGWTFDDSNGQIEVPNPLGVVPLVEFRNQALLDDDPISDIAGVKAMQDSINLVWAYLLNALDYASLPARVVTGADVPKEPSSTRPGRSSVTVRSNSTGSSTTASRSCRATTRRSPNGRPRTSTCTRRSSSTPSSTSQHRPAPRRTT
jgi:hypothetical protein